MNKNTGGSAFPTLDFTHAGQIIPGSDGMTLRDYFAASALSGLGGDSGVEDDLAGYAAWAYRMADHMLMAREL